MRKPIRKIDIYILIDNFGKVVSSTPDLYQAWKDKLYWWFESKDKKYIHIIKRQFVFYPFHDEKNEIKELK